MGEKTIQGGEKWKDTFGKTDGLPEWSKLKEKSKQSVQRKTGQNTTFHQKGGTIGGATKLLCFACVNWGGKKRTGGF